MRSLAGAEDVLGSLGDVDAFWRRGVVGNWCPIRSAGSRAGSEVLFQRWLDQECIAGFYAGFNRAAN